MSDYYDREGEPIDCTTWARLFHDKSYQRVAQDTVGDYFVSTVWLGLDHSFGFGDAPVIFETMVFGGESEDFQRRYSTEDEARAGHAEILNEVQLFAQIGRL